MKHLFLFFLCFAANIGYTQAPRHIWANSTDVNSYGESLCTDSHGNVYQTGVFRGAVDFDPSSAVYMMTATDSMDIFIAKKDADGHFLWSQQFGVPAKNDVGTSITIDHKDRVCVTGTFNDTVDFAAGPVVAELKSGWPGKSAFVLQVDAGGNFIWAKSFLGNVSPRTIKTDADNNIYVIGYYRDSVNFEPSSVAASFKGEGNFLLKLHHDGTFVWVKRIGDLSATALLSFAVNKYSEVYCTGAFSKSGNLDMDGGSGMVNGSGCFVCKMDSNGIFKWVKQIDRTGVSSLYIWAMGLDTAGNLYATGQFADSIDFDPSPSVFPLTTASYRNTQVVIFSWDSGGNFTWARAMGNDMARGLAIAVDSLGNSYVQGNYSGTINFDPVSSAYLFSSPVTQDIFVAALDAGGKTRWAKSMGGSTDDFAGAIVLGPAGTIYNSGNFIDEIFFDSSVLYSGISRNGFFVEKMSSVPLKIKEAVSNGQFTLYPNPATNMVTVVLNSTPQPEYKLVLYDMTGRMLVTGSCMSSATMLDLRSLLPGNYVLVLRDGARPLGAHLLQKQ